MMPGKRHGRWARRMASGVCILLAAVSDGCFAQPPDQQILVMIKDPPLHHFRPDEAYGIQYQSKPPSTSVARTIEDVNREFGLTRVDDWPMPSLNVRCFLETIGPDQLVSNVLAKLTGDARIESVEPVQSYRTLGHNDAYYSLQTSAKQLKLDALHEMATGRHVRIAQIDSGAELTHPDLSDQIVDSPNLVDTSVGTPYDHSELHGTAVAGIMVAKADNHVGIVGVAPDARVLALRACWQAHADDPAAHCSSFTLAKAVQYALLHHVQVINMSLAGPPDPLLTRLLEQAHEQGIHIVSAVDPDATPGLGFPAGLPFVIAVSSVRETPDMTAPTDYVLAPGERVLTTTPHASWGFVTGNSFAAAQVSGAIALLLEASPHLDPSQMSRLLRNGARSTGGTSALDVCQLLAQQKRHAPCPCCEMPRRTQPTLSANGS